LAWQAFFWKAKIFCSSERGLWPLLILFLKLLQSPRRSVSQALFWAWSFVPGRAVAYLGFKAFLFRFYEQVMKFHTWLWNVIPGYEIPYLDIKFCPWIWNVVPGYETCHPGTNMLWETTIFYCPILTSALSIFH
jgi:hypothetical protein